jgi:hypothetical protein
MLSFSFALCLLIVQLGQLSSFRNTFAIQNRRINAPLYANPLFFGGRKLPVKESDKPKEVVVKDVVDEEVDEDDVLQLVKIHDEERLQKVIARAGLASRREAEKMVSHGYLE